MSYFVYTLQNEFGSFYVGQTNNLQKRFQRHNNNRVKAAKGPGSWEIVQSEEFATRAEAMMREKEIKAHKSQAYINILVRPSRV